MMSKLWLDTVVYHQRALSTAADLVGYERLLFGTDHPFFKDSPDTIFATVAEAFSQDQTELEAVSGQNAMSFFDPAKDDWIAEAGQFEVLVGASSRDIRLEGGFLLL